MTLWASYTFPFGSFLRIKSPAYPMNWFPRRRVAYLARLVSAACIFSSLVATAVGSHPVEAFFFETDDLQ